MKWPNPDPKSPVSEQVREMWFLAQLFAADQTIVDGIVADAEALVAAAPDDIEALDYLDALHVVQRRARYPVRRDGSAG